VITAGSRAPDFSLRDQDGNNVSLGDLAGERVLLVFYPNDFSQVCTDQLSVYEDALPDLAAQACASMGCRSTPPSATPPSAAIWT
jgi:peroxiredoxin